MTPCFSNILKYHGEKPTKAAGIPCSLSQTLKTAVMVSCVLVALALVCLWQVQISGGHRHDLENVAYSKKVTLSSEYKDPGYSGSKVVNGLYSDLAHTGHERFPWLRIDLGGHYVIHEVEVFARSDCCGMYI